MALCEDLTAVMNMSSMDGACISAVEVCRFEALDIAFQLYIVNGVYSAVHRTAIAVVIDIQATTAVFAAYGVDLAIEDDARMVD